MQTSTASDLRRVWRLLGGSWVVISRVRVISPLIWIVTLLITPLITTHEPPSRSYGKCLLQLVELLQGGTATQMELPSCDQVGVHMWAFENWNRMLGIILHCRLFLGDTRRYYSDHHRSSTKTHIQALKDLTLPSRKS